MYTTVGSQSHEVNVLTVFFGISEGGNNSRVLQNAIVGTCTVDFYQVLIYDTSGTDIEDAAKRVEALKKLGNITIYAQAERNQRQGIVPNKMQLEFAQRYVYSGSWRQMSWDEYLARG